VCCPLADQTRRPLHSAHVAAMSRPVDKLTPELLDLLTGDALPPGAYLVEQRDDGERVLWRLSDGAPPDGALDPAPGWSHSVRPHLPPRKLA